MIKHVICCTLVNLIFINATYADGNRLKPYYLSESEMMIGYVAPGYKDLSKDEQEIWNELEKEKEVL